MHELARLPHLVFATFPFEHITDIVADTHMLFLPA